MKYIMVKNVRITLFYGLAVTPSKSARDFCRVFRNGKKWKEN